MKIEVKSNIQEGIKRLDDIGRRQVPFATAVALTKTAQAVKDDLKAEMGRVFHNPTPYTLNSLFMKPATKARPEAVVWLKDFSFKGIPATKYLAPQIYGGARNAKRSERMLQRMGLLPDGMYWVPGQGARLNQYGNISGGQITQILSALGASPDQFQNRTSRSMQRAMARGSLLHYFVARPGSHLRQGVWQRTKRGVKPALMFVRSPQYQPRLDFFGVAEKTVNREFSAQFEKAFRFALSTQR
jgi:hypothetical protein